MDADIVTHWPDGIEVEVPGEPGTGRLSINYGVELTVSLRFDVTLAGVRYRWEGDIPVPSIPEDLRMAAVGPFDPFLLPPSERPFGVTDTTDRVAVVMYDALGGFIPVPGVGGGLAVTVQGELAARYQTEQVVVSSADPILMEGLATLLRAMDGDFGPRVDVVVHPEGTLEWEGTLRVVPELYLSFAGTRRDYPLVEIPIPFVDREANVIFEDVTQTVPLPDISVTPNPIELGPVAASARDEQLLTVANEGDAPLEVTFLSPGAPFAVGSAMAIIPPRATGSLRVWFEPDAAGDVTDVLVLETNDPDEPTVEVTLSGTATAAPASDAGGPADGGTAAGPSDDGGCGCHIVRDRPGIPLGVAGIGLAVVVTARRRRRAG
jgi:hypothetical protein